MPKLHARLSVEIEVTEEELRHIFYDVGENKPHYGPHDVEVNEVQIDWAKAKPCDWDDGGYIPSSWLEYDAVDAGIVSVEEVGV